MDAATIAKIISSGLGFMEARDKSGSTMRPKQQWYANNPSMTTPFYSSVSKWNKGNPSVDRQMSPQLQQAFDDIIWGALGEGRTPRTMSNNLGRLQNLQEQNQLGRYGLTGDPYSPKVDADGEQGYDPIGTNDPQGNQSGGRYVNPTGKTYRDEIQDAAMYRDSNDFNRSYEQGSPLGNPFGDTYNASDIEKLFGQKDIGSLAQLDLSENAGLYGEIVGMLSGIPMLGNLAQYFGDRNIGNKNWMSPTDPLNPYGADNLAGNIIRDNADQNLGRSGMNEGNTNPATGGRMHTPIPYRNQYGGGGQAGIPYSNQYGGWQPNQNTSGGSGQGGSGGGWWAGSTPWWEKWGKRRGSDG